VRVLAGDGRALLWAAAAATAPERPGPLVAVRAFFPDPWPKRRHRQRRLVDAAFVGAAATALAPGGVLELATDDASYAGAMTDLVRAEARFEPAGPPARADRPRTYYERRAIEAGRRVHDIRARRIADTATGQSPHAPGLPR